MRRLSAEALAAEAETTVERIDDLVRVGVLRPDGSGLFTSGDIQRARIVDAFEASGIDLALIEHAVSRRWTTFEETDAIYPDPGRRSDRSVGAFTASLGSRGEVLGSVLAAFGLPTPTATTRLTEEDERVLTRFLDAWTVSDDVAVPVRAARIVGEAMRRTAHGWIDLFTEQVTHPLEDRTRTIDEVIPVTVPRASPIVDRAPEVLVWLFRRHLETGLNEVNTASMEAGLAREGLLAQREIDPPAIAFADLAGFTRLTEELGDELAARLAARLAELSTDIALKRAGRLVKLLGDGAMLHFPRPADAVAAMLDLVSAAAAEGLPAAHVGIAAGPVVARDGDFFGHTVNLAARLAGLAGPGEILVTRNVVDAAPTIGLAFEPLGDVALKNVALPVAAFRAVSAR